jgi:hypothetical protein
VPLPDHHLLIAVIQGFALRDEAQQDSIDALSN